MTNLTDRELLIRIDERQRTVLRHLKELNGQVSMNKTNIRRLVFGIVVGSTVWIKESRDAMLRAFTSIFGL